jgi:hypothetical protein
MNSSDNPIKLTVEDLEPLFGPKLFIMDQVQVAINPKSEVATPSLQHQESLPEPKADSIKWKPKPTSKVLFVLHESEMKDKACTELLKKIVASIGIPFESAGFGVMTSKPDRDAFSSMPNRIAVVFDKEVAWETTNPIAEGFGEVFFAHTLTALESDRTYKQELWNYLKALRDQLS